MNNQRPAPVTVAVVFLGLVFLLSLISPFLPTDYPTIVIYLGVALGVGGLVATAGLWAMRRWGLSLKGGCEPGRQTRHGRDPDAEILGLEAAQIGTRYPHVESGHGMLDHSGSCLERVMNFEQALLGADCGRR